MKAFLIDPIVQTSARVCDGDYDHICSLLSDPKNGLEVDTFTIVRIDRSTPVRNVLLVDDNGLLKEPRHFFRITSYTHPLAGRGLVFGEDEIGERVSTTLSFQELSKLVRYTAR
jgi:hypothetical protein